MLGGERNTNLFVFLNRRRISSSAEPNNPFPSAIDYTSWHAISLSHRQIFSTHDTMKVRLGKFARLAQMSYPPGAVYFYLCLAYRSRRNSSISGILYLNGKIRTIISDTGF
jgi:hypothetical protein